MDTIIKQIYSQDLSGLNVESITKGKAKTMLYKDLSKYKNIIDIFGKYNAVIMLFPVASDISGHWIAILHNKQSKSIEHFDPYGFSWKQELNYSNNQFVRENLLGNLYTKAIQDGYIVSYNPNNYQRLSNGINTCGRHSCIRVRFDYLNEDEYSKMMLKQSISPDYIVSIMTLLSLLEDKTDEKQIIQDLLRI